ncbi:MAG: IS630 family transposase [Thermomicrobiales bacterium]
MEKGGLAAGRALIEAQYPDRPVALWTEDEHRLGLLPTLRRVWAPCGQRPHARVCRRFQWVYVYGFVQPDTGQSWWCLLPTVSLAAMTVALAAFVRDEGIDAEHPVALVVDNAGWHRSPRLLLPPGLHLLFLPPYSPELQPAERLWPLVDEAVANQVFPDITALEDALVARCQVLEAQPARIRAHTCFHWWPVQPGAANTM